MKVLICIANFGTKNLTHLERMIREFRSMPYEIEIVVDTTVALDRFEGITQRMFDESIGRRLVFTHRPYMAERRHEFDLFVFTENDILITHRNLEAYLRVTSFLPDGQITGFMRYETKGDASKRLLIDAHPSFPTVKNAHRYIRGRRFFTMHNLHQACYVLTPPQLERAVRSGGYLVESHHRVKGKQFYGELESGSSDVFTQCGFAWKVLPYDALNDLLVHHLSEKFVHMGGIRQNPGYREPSALWRDPRASLLGRLTDKLTFTSRGAAAC
ncbi:MAG: hypothetical protein AAF800_05595 [Planctomycetota bacterium]